MDKRWTQFLVDRAESKADREARTPDLLITNELLYQLSYIGECIVFLENNSTK